MERKDRRETQNKKRISIGNKQLRFSIKGHSFQRHITADGVHGDVLGEHPGDALRVAVDSVEEPGEGEAEDGSQEKHPDHHFLLDRSHQRHVGSEHVHQSQKDENQTACRETMGGANDRREGELNIIKIVSSCRPPSSSLCPSSSSAAPR